MKSALIRVLFLLCATGVFGDVERVSVIEGESVNFHTGVTEVQRDDEIEWRLNGYRIARIRDGSISTEGASKDRLKLDRQTGDLKITNIRTTDSGEYKLEITSTRGSSEKIFSVSVVSGDDEVKSVSVMVGDSVTLNSGTHIQRDDVIEWKFGDLNTPIAEINRKTGIFSTSDGPDGRFRDRLELDYTTGSLTIRKIEIKHSGFYEAVIRKSGSGHTIYKSYSVTATGEIKSALSVSVGKSVTLNSDLTDIQRVDLMQWMFEDSQIAEISKKSGRFLTSDGPDGRFRDRLKLDRQTGSLTITDTTYTDSGLYELKISSIRHTIYRRIAVSVTGLSTGAKAAIVIVVLLACAAAGAGVGFYYRRKISEIKAWVYKGRIVSVIVGESITLNPDGVRKGEKLVWTFGDSCIARRESGADRFILHDDLPERFKAEPDSKSRLELNDQTGSLTIPETKTTDTGVYELRIFRSGKSSLERFKVSVFDKPDRIENKPVKKGESVTLPTGVDDMKKDDEILWKFGYTPLAEIKTGSKNISPFADEIFEGRLEIDDKTKSLTIKKIRPTDDGIYMLYNLKSGTVRSKSFRVKVVSDPTDFRNNPEENVPLNSLA